MPHILIVHNVQGKKLSFAWPAGEWGSLWPLGYASPAHPGAGGLFCHLAGVHRVYMYSNCMCKEPEVACEVAVSVSCCFPLYTLYYVLVCFTDACPSPVNPVYFVPFPIIKS